MTHPIQQFWLTAFALLLAAFFVVQARSLGQFERDYDEGVYLAEAHLLHEGEPLYTRVKSASPPFFIWGLAAVFAAAGGPSVVAARLAVIASGALGLLAMAWIGQRLAPPSHQAWVALLAPLLLLLLPRWLLYGQMAMADVPSLSLSLLAVALALESWRSGRRWLVLGGVVAGLAVGTKFLAAYTAPLLALVVVLRYGPARPFRLLQFVADGLATLGGFVLPLLLALPFLDLRAAYEVVIRFPWEAGRQWQDPAAALRLMAVFHAEHLGWSLLALLGLFGLVRRGMWRVAALLLGWEALVVLLLSQHAPLWGHLLLPLAPPVALAGALALAEGLRARRGRGALPALAAALLFVALWPLALRADRATVVAPADQALLRDQVVPWLQAVVPPGERIMSDDPMIAVRAGRLLPPDVTDTSFTKLASGFLSSDDLITVAERDRPAAILFWSDRFRGKEDWREWVEANYRVGYQRSPTQRIFLRPELAQE